jgi:hypothetical protein
LTEPETANNRINAVGFTVEIRLLVQPWNLIFPRFDFQAFYVQSMGKVSSNGLLKFCSQNVRSRAVLTKTAHFFNVFEVVCRKDTNQLSQRPAQ